MMSPQFFRVFSVSSPNSHFSHPKMRCPSHFELCEVIISRNSSRKKCTLFPENGFFGNSLLALELLCHLLGNSEIELRSARSCRRSSAPNRSSQNANHLLAGKISCVKRPLPSFLLSSPPLQTCGWSPRLKFYLKATVQPPDSIKEVQ